MYWKYFIHISDNIEWFSWGSLVYYGQDAIFAWHDPLLQQTVEAVGQDPWVVPSPGPFEPETFTQPPHTPIVPTVEVPHKGFVAS